MASDRDTSVQEALELIAGHDCLDWAEGSESGFDCTETGTCITTWCPPCIVRAVTRPKASPPVGGAPELDWRRVVGVSTSHPLTRVVERLADAANILLDRYDYDGLGHEGIRYAERAARAYLRGEDPDHDVIATPSPESRASTPKGPGYSEVYDQAMRDMMVALRVAGVPGVPEPRDNVAPVELVHHYIAPLLSAPKGVEPPDYTLGFSTFNGDVEHSPRLVPCEGCQQPTSRMEWQDDTGYPICPSCTTVGAPQGGAAPPDEATADEKALELARTLVTTSGIHEDYQLVASELLRVSGASGREPLDVRSPGKHDGPRESSGFAFNLNSYVHWTPNDRGARLWNKSRYQGSPDIAVADEERSDQLWEFANIIGPALRMGAPPPCKYLVRLEQECGESEPTPLPEGALWDMGTLVLANGRRLRFSDGRVRLWSDTWDSHGTGGPARFHPTTVEEALGVAAVLSRTTGGE